MLKLDLDFRCRRPVRAALVSLSVLLLASGAFALPILNGSFESGPAVTDHTPLAGGSTAITGWQVTGVGIDYIGSYWMASDGNRSLDLNGLEAGGIQQVLDTVVGQTYDVIFDVSRNPDGAAGTYSVEVSAAGEASVIDYDETGVTHSNMLWETVSFQFTATSTATTLAFEALGSGPFGPALDNVRVAEVFPVPEPSTALLTGMALAGLGAARRRRS